jgi:hypothetical protein
MRRSRTAPLVETQTECCCSGILTAMPIEFPWWQSITFGTTAWRISMARRQVVESANSALKGAFADLSRGFFRVVGLVKTTVLLDFTLAAYNLDRVRSNKGQAWAGRQRPSGREAQAEPGPPALRYLDRSRREQPGSAADAAAERPPSPQAGPSARVGFSTPGAGSKRRRRRLSRIRRSTKGANGVRTSVRRRPGRSRKTFMNTRAPLSGTPHR